MKLAPARKVCAVPSPAGLVIAGFDPGITTPAITVVQRKAGGGFACLHHRVIRTNASDSDVSRYNQIVDHMSETFARFKPSLLVGEEQQNVQQGKKDSGDFNANNSKTMITVGLACAVARIYRITWLEGRTQSIRVKVMGKGTSRASKHDVQNYVERVLGMKLPQDSAEAALNALYGFLLHPSERAA